MTDHGTDDLDKTAAEPSAATPSLEVPEVTAPEVTVLDVLVLDPNTAEPVTAELAVNDPELAEAVAAEAIADPAASSAATLEPDAALVAPSVPVPHAPRTAQTAMIPAIPLAAAGTNATLTSGPTPESFGRVDADGTVFVRTSAGEVPVGQFQAGSPDEALAYYIRKFTALETEVVLLEQRLSGGADVAVDEAAATVDRITAALETPQVVGDIDGLRARVAALTPAIEKRRAAARAAKSKAREAAKAAREAIVVEAESLAEATSWKSSGDRLRVLLDEWKVAPRVDRGTEQALWKRFSAARNHFDRRRRAHFAKLSGEQSEAKATKTALVKEAEELSTSTDWAPTATKFRTLMDEWKASGRASRSDDDALWSRFRAAQDTFFSARSAAFDERDAGQSDNLAAKEALATAAEALLPLGDLATAKSSLRDIQERWERLGHVPRSDKERVDGRLRRVEQAIREAEESKWKRTNPEARARAEATVELLETAIAKLNKTLASATAAGDAKKIAETTEALEARQAWLDEAQRALTEFSGA